jgi:sensor histidine kinase YesM
MQKRIFRYLLITIGIALMIHFINFAAMGYNTDFLLSWKPIVVNYSYAAIIGVANIIFFKIINKEGAWDHHPKQMIFKGVVGSVIISTIAFFLARLFHFVVIEGFTFSYFLEVEHINNYIFSMLIAFILTLIFHLFYFYKALKDSKINEQASLAAVQKAQLQAVKDQLDPHFLFNSLNVLTSLIEENPENAQDFTTGLSRIYRYVLEQKEKDVVALEDELMFAKRYVELLKMRFEDSVNLSIDVKDTKGIYLLPLSLQLVLENAVKHNIISKQKPLSIYISKTNTHLLIENTLQLKTQLSNRKGVGLENIKYRYKLISNEKIKIEQTSNRFKIALPLVKK